MVTKWRWGWRADVILLAASLLLASGFMDVMEGLPIGQVGWRTLLLVAWMAALYLAVVGAVKLISLRKR